MSEGSMRELIHFVIFYHDKDRAAAEALRTAFSQYQPDDSDQPIGFIGDLYGEGKATFANWEELHYSCVAKFFVASENVVEDRKHPYRLAKKYLMEKKDVYMYPIWLTPGHRQLREKPHLSGFNNVRGLKANDANMSDVEYIKTTLESTKQMKEIKQAINNKYQYKTDERNKKVIELGSESKGPVAGVHLTAEKTTGQEDVLGHEKFAEKIVDVMVENAEFETPSTIGIFAPWGSGKSRFISSMKGKCKPKPKMFHLKQAEVKCCCCFRISWCAKLVILSTFTALITAGLVTSAVYVTYLHTIDGSTSDNDTLALTNTTLIPTTENPCELDDVTNDRLDFWTFSAISLVVIIFLVLTMSCFQRKVCAECLPMWKDCCGGVEADEEDTRDKHGGNKNNDNNQNGDNIEMKEKKDEDRQSLLGTGKSAQGTSNNLRSGTNRGQDGENRPPNPQQGNSGNNQNVHKNSQAPDTAGTKTSKRKCCTNLCLDTKAMCFMSFFKPPKQPKNEEEKKDIQIIPVEFNAWEYSGCDYLWAGIVTTLGTTIEDYFGQWKVRMSRLVVNRQNDDEDDDNEGDGRNQSTKYPRSYSYLCCKMRHKRYIILLLAIACLIVATTLAVIAGTEFPEAKCAFEHSWIYVWIVSSLGALTILVAAFGQVTSKLVESTQSVVENIRKEMMGEDFQQELGFMHRVKEEVHRITDMINFMSRLYGKHFRVLLIIDDLDRCQPKRIMGVLEAVSLLLEPKDDKTRSPFISVLAIDPRVVLGAIERHFDPDKRRDFTQANVNGYEYLKKIIHMPFCLPGPSRKEKQDYIDILLKKPIVSQNTEQAGIIAPQTTSSPANAPKDQAETNIDSPDDAPDNPAPGTSAQPPPSWNLEPPLTPEELILDVKRELKDPQLLEFVHGNPRTLKRICNVILLAINVYRGAMGLPSAFKLMLVVLMVEQWPFRTSFLRQYYMNQKQKAIDNEKFTRISKGGLVVRHIPPDTPEEIKKLEGRPLVEVWRTECKKVPKVRRWKKFLSYDFDPELFYAFISTYRMEVKDLDEFMKYAVNHDTNIESIVEQGLAELDLQEQCALGSDAAPGADPDRRCDSMQAEYSDQSENAMLP